MTNEEAIKKLIRAKIVLNHQAETLNRYMRYDRDGINKAINKAIAVLRQNDDTDINRFDEFCRITDFIEEKTGERYELIYDHDEPNMATLIRRGNK